MVGWGLTCSWLISLSMWSFWFYHYINSKFQNLCHADNKYLQAKDVCKCHIYLSYIKLIILICPWTVSLFSFPKYFPVVHIIIQITHPLPGWSIHTVYLYYDNQQIHDFLLHIHFYLIFFEEEIKPCFSKLRITHFIFLVRTMAYTTCREFIIMSK